MTHFSIYYVVSDKGKELTWGSILVEEDIVENAVMRVLIQLESIMPVGSEAITTFHQLKRCVFHVRGDDEKPLTTVTDTFQEDAVDTFVWDIKRKPDEMEACYSNTRNTTKRILDRITMAAKNQSE